MTTKSAIEIACKGSRLVDLEDLEAMQGDLKSLSDEDFDKLYTEIVDTGFAFPIRVWRAPNGDEKIMGGHQAVRVLSRAREMGHWVPAVPVSDIYAKDEKEAARRVLQDASQYGTVDRQGTYQFMIDHGFELKDLSDSFKLPSMSLDWEDFGKEFIVEPTVIPPAERNDVIPVVPGESKVVRGDVFTMGRHRLMCGDSTSIDDIDVLMAGSRAEICFTSPPYNAGSMNISDQKGTGKKYNLFDDNQSDDEYRDFLISNINCIMTVCDDVLYNIGLVEGNKRVIIDVMAHYREQFKDIIYWKKSSVAPHIQPGIINNQVEFILCFGNGRRKFEHAQFSQGTYFNVIEGANASGNEFANIHKATFPLYLPENIIMNFSSPGAGVLDTFGGTGTTMIAAEKLGRCAYLMELDPRYCAAILNRWAQFTGEDPVRQADGQPWSKVQS